jgi:hypothetical protein
MPQDKSRQRIAAHALPQKMALHSGGVPVVLVEQKRKELAALDGRERLPRAQNPGVGHAVHGAQAQQKIIEALGFLRLVAGDERQPRPGEGLPQHLMVAIMRGKKEAALAHLIKDGRGLRHHP